MVLFFEVAKILESLLVRPPPLECSALIYVRATVRDCWALFFPHLAPLQLCSWHPSSPRLALPCLVCSRLLSVAALLYLPIIFPLFFCDEQQLLCYCLALPRLALPTLSVSPQSLMSVSPLSSPSALQHPSSWWPSPIPPCQCSFASPIDRWFLPSFCPRNIPPLHHFVLRCYLSAISALTQLFHFTIVFSPFTPLCNFPFLSFLLHSVFTVNRASAYLLLQCLYPPSRFWLILSTFCFPSFPPPGRASTQMLILSFFLFSSSYLPVLRAQLFPSLSHSLTLASFFFFLSSLLHLCACLARGRFRFMVPSRLGCFDFCSLCLAMHYLISNSIVPFLSQWAHYSLHLYNPIRVCTAFNPPDPLIPPCVHPKFQSRRYFQHPGYHQWLHLDHPWWERRTLWGLAHDNSFEQFLFQWKRSSFGTHRYTLWQGYFSIDIPCPPMFPSPSFSCHLPCFSIPYI